MKNPIYLIIQALLLAVGITLMLIGAVTYETWVPIISMWSLLFMLMVPCICWNPYAITDPFSDGDSNLGQDLGFFFAGIFFISAIAPLAMLAHVGKLPIEVLYFCLGGWCFIVVAMLLFLKKLLKKEQNKIF